MTKESKKQSPFEQHCAKMGWDINGEFRLIKLHDLDAKEIADLLYEGGWYLEDDDSSVCPFFKHKEIKHCFYLDQIYPASLSDDRAKAVLSPRFMTIHEALYFAATNPGLVFKYGNEVATSFGINIKNTESMENLEWALPCKEGEYEWKRLTVDHL